MQTAAGGEPVHVVQVAELTGFAACVDTDTSSLPGLDGLLDEVMRHQ